MVSVVFIMLSFSLFGHCIVCSSVIYGFLLPLWYLQTFIDKSHVCCSVAMINTLVALFLVCLKVISLLKSLLVKSILSFFVYSNEHLLTILIKWGRLHCTCLWTEDCIESYRSNYHSIAYAILAKLNMMWCAIYCSDTQVGKAV